MPLSALKPKKVVGGTDKMLFMRYAEDLVDVLDVIAEAFSEPVGDDKYKVKGKVGKWRETEYGPLFFPDDGSKPTAGLPKDAKGGKPPKKGKGKKGKKDKEGGKEKDIFAKLDDSIKLAQKKGNKEAVKRLQNLRKALGTGDPQKIAKAAEAVAKTSDKIAAETAKTKKDRKKPSKKKPAKKQAAAAPTEPKEKKAPKAKPTKPPEPEKKEEPKTPVEVKPEEDKPAKKKVVAKKKPAGKKKRKKSKKKKSAKKGS